ncbi:hypothetical protein EXU48_04315 [Occultella glacieicola]|uniref:Uncharacterized protein n=1 Tax=Occultella glacieicola TaxID=2518684 RepID=A0ABY2E792_9MICO|nr:hypothetical protein [Occultella glacieicola]TDE97426.1 hypothetical protein EXU48_04315 [Occultella glacieicola]
MIFGFGRKKAAAVPALDLRRDGAGFADVRTEAEVDAAVGAGRLEWFWMTSPRFGGPELPMNRLAGPPGVGAARDWIDDQIGLALQRGEQVSGGADMTYDDGGSRVPRVVTYDFGAAGRYVLNFW